MPVDAKICGLTTPDAVDAALGGGARYLGFVVFPPSPRHVTPVDAARLADRARGKADIVAVTVNADDTLLADIRNTLKPDWIQLHGSESPDRVREAKTYAGKGVIKALPISGRADLAAVEIFADAADLFLFDAKPPKDASRPGGWGEAFDWTLLKGAAISRPWLLSGGLTPANVRAAVSASGAGAVDVSSGVESAPGVKDNALIARFLEECRK